jgi:hypothetical protein
MLEKLEIWLRKLIRKLPFYEALAKFGARVKKVLRKNIPIYNAYLNRDIRLDDQFFPNPNYCSLRVTGPVTRDMMLTLTHTEKENPMMEDLSRIEGIKRVIPEPYYVKIEKEDSTDWQEILPQAKQIVKGHLIKL